MLDDVKSQDDVEPGVHQRKLFCISLDDKRLRKATPGLLQQLYMEVQRHNGIAKATKLRQQRARAAADLENTACATAVGVRQPAQEFQNETATRSKPEMVVIHSQETICCRGIEAEGMTPSRSGSGIWFASLPHDLRPCFFRSTLCTLAVPGSHTTVGSMVRRERSEINIDRPPRAASTHLNRDLAVSGALACVAAVVSYVFVHDYGRVFFYQSFMPSIVMYACGHVFVEPVVRPAELGHFLAGSAAAFNCDVLAETRHTQTPVPFTYSHFYLAMAIGQTWRWMGVSYQKLWPLLALLHAAYAVGAFALARLFLPRSVSIVVASLIAVSPIAVSMMSALRDYAKAPFALWALVFLLLSIRARSLNSLLAFAALAGATVGIGRGFRSELAMFIPVGAVALAIGLDRRFRIGARVGAPVAFLAVAFVALLPTQSPHRGQQGLLMMEGLAEPFRRHLGLGAAPYDLGFQYADELVLASIAADLRRPDPSGYDSSPGFHPVE